MLLTFRLEDVVDKWIDAVDCSPWPAHAGRQVFPREHPQQNPLPARPRHQPKNAPASTARRLYTPDQRRRRDASRWTLVQGILAPIQFVVFLVSLGLVLRYLLAGEGLALASASIVVKTLVLYLIMITGSIWEHDVFGRYLFARPFFWEDVVSILVLALHTLYLVALLTGAVSVHAQFVIALTAYAAYVINAAQFVLKLRAARLEETTDPTRSPALPSNGGLGMAE